jgi:hypothetical protein
MVKTVHNTKRTFSGANSDAALLEMIRRHGELLCEMDQIYAIGGDDATDGPGYQAASDSAMDLENRIVATQPTTRAEVAAKLRFIKKIKFVTPYGSLQTGDLGALVQMILRMDEERIGAGKTRKPQVAAGATA